MTGDFKPFSTDNNREIYRLEAALTAAGVGTWELDLTTNEFLLCNRFNVLFDEAFENVTTFDKILSKIHAGDRERVESEIMQKPVQGKNRFFNVEFRLPDNHGEATRWINFKGETESDANGVHMRIAGVALDVSQKINLTVARDIAEVKSSKAHFKTMVEQAPMAIGLLVGHDMVIDVANERIIEAWGKDSSVIGKKLADALPEVKGQGFLELLQNVYKTGKPFFGNEHAVNIQRDGVYEKVFFDFVYTPLRSSEGDISGVMVMATEVTEKVISMKNLEASEARFRSLIQQAPVSTCLFVGKEMRIEIANEQAIRNWGKGWSVIGKPISEALPELATQEIFKILDHVFESGVAYEGKGVPIYLEKNGTAETCYYDFTFKPVCDAAGDVYAVLDMAVDVTDKIVGRKALEESEAKLRSVIENAPAAIGLFVGRDLVVEMPNQAFIDIVGKGSDITGKPLRDVMPELESQAFLQILDDVYTSGIMYQSAGIQVDIVRKGVMTHNFYNITYSPLFDQEGKVYGILDIAIDVTNRMMEQKQIEESQMELLNLFEQSPVAIAIISGEELRFEMVNKFYGNLVGRPVSEMTGKLLFEALPELAGQGFDVLLKDVMKTGTPFISHEQAVEVIIEEKLATIYVDLTYQPRTAQDGTINGVLVVATDITGQVLARKEIFEAESMLREAVELAELGTWQIDLQTKELYFSPRLRSWFNIAENETVTLERIYSVIRESDLPIVTSAVNQAITHGMSAIYDVEFELIALPSGMKRIVHAVGSAVYDDKGQPVKISGNVQDVTIQRELQLSLEYQVQNRTEELEATNEELAAINDQFTSANDELAKTNQMLIRSNENLQRFAYVASHDLQEPLRKIQSFGDLLRNRFPDELGGGAEYLQRMQAAAKRMSSLIEDLLAFSRISDKEIMVPVPLKEVLNIVLNDLELVVHQTEADISIGHLPTVLGDRLQLGQLFQNLISNALKFRSQEIKPEIRIVSNMITVSEIPANVQPARISDFYFRIDVSDNGIGFDNKHVNRIFQIFQRLHGKTEFVGTGIGLAICEKVAASHGGAITATSEIGRGSTFSIFIPI